MRVMISKKFALREIYLVFISDVTRLLNMETCTSNQLRLVDLMTKDILNWLSRFTMIIM